MLLVVLLYVTLDLSVPAIPGAFVFEPTDSLEFNGARVGESMADLVVQPAQAGLSVAVSPPLVDRGDALEASGSVALFTRPMLKRLPRATLDPAPPSEDPH